MFGLRISRQSLVAGAFLGSVAAGQLFRVSAGSSSGSLILIDLALASLSLALVFWLIRDRRSTRPIFRDVMWVSLFGFVAWAVLALAINSGDYTSHEVVSAGAYALRLATIVIFGALLALDSQRYREALTEGFVYVGAATVLLGFWQLVFVGNFIFMTGYGWDPHIGRLLSTFFDPNLYGVFLVLVMCIALGRAFAAHRGQAWPYAAVFGVSWVALFLTYSRSAWVVGAIAVTGLVFFRSMRWALLVGLIFIAAFFVPSRLSDRFSETKQLANQQNYKPEGYRCDAAKTGGKCDESGSNRIYSLQQAWSLTKTHLITGVGYNAYGAALVKENLAAGDRLEKHSANGSDSSILNIWATTGIIGLAAFTLFMGTVLVRLWRASRDSLSSYRWVATGLMCFTVAWLFGSFLNNTVLYVLILAPWLALVAVTLGVKQQGGNRG